MRPSNSVILGFQRFSAVSRHFQRPLGATTCNPLLHRREQTVPSAMGRFETPSLARRASRYAVQLEVDHKKQVICSKAAVPEPKSTGKNRPTADFL